MLLKLQNILHDVYYISMQILYLTFTILSLQF